MVLLMTMCMLVQNSDKATQLFQAVNTSGPVAAIRDLLDKGAPVDAANNDGVTALMLASYLGNDATVRLLLGRGAKINAQEAKGNTPLIYAVAHDRPEHNAAVIEMLLAAGADPNLAASNGDTPLMVLTRADKPGIRSREFVALLSLNADINIQDRTGRTPLMNLVVSLDGQSEEELSILDFAFQQPVDFGIKDKAGFSLEDIVKTKNNQLITAMFEKYRPEH